METGQPRRMRRISDGARPAGKGMMLAKRGGDREAARPGAGKVRVRLEGGFYVISFPYDGELVDKVRTLPQREYDPARKFWKVRATPAALAKMKSIRLWKSILDTGLPCPPHIIYSIGMADVNWLLTNVMLNQICKPKKAGKKLPERLARIQADWERPGPIRLMFQDEASFGRIAETHRCRCPKPERPACPTMVNQASTYAYGAVSIGDGQWDSLILPHINIECIQIF